jgi:hypothetical protein
MACDDGIALGCTQQIERTRRLNVAVPLTQRLLRRGLRADPAQPAHQH